ncbi:DUF2931 family protein [Pedobacter sp. PLR]|uniref:DUF2931 family protein n=1 Tax=Pedobacter sp. PLR TaxID=2994465 RepID=UPI00224866DD|nr:DUF2931 family protein [Pedobacter sp. PLR]MCX2451711.1 DUF2931 family protein [Pedobacter sp. PLR]
MKSEKNKYLLLLLTLLAFIGCKGQKVAEKFEWTGTVSAPEEYPIEVYKGAIIASDFTYDFDAIWGTQNTGWGNDGGIMSVSTKQMEAPDSLSFTWLSLVENKFYTGKWKLDKNRIVKLFREGFINTMNHKKETYKLIKVGLAPKGRVMVWLSGAGFQTEVGTFQAHDTTVTAVKAYENAKYMFKPNYIQLTLADDMVMKPEIKARIKQYGQPDMDIYEAYRKRYDWRPQIILPDGGKAATLFYSYLNGEQENRFGEELISNRYISRAVPNYITLIWKDKGGKRNGFEIRPFDEKEILAAYSKLGGANSIDLIIKLNEDGMTAEVSLKNKEKEIKLTRSKIKISEDLD